MAMIDEKSATAWVVRCLTLTFDNDESLYNEVTEAAHAAVRENGRASFESVLPGSEERAGDIHEVGVAVADAIEGLLETALESVPDTFRDLVWEVLDLNSAETYWQLGEHYFPESADEVDWDV